MSFLIGLYVAVIAFSASMCIKLLVNLKFAAIYARILDVSTRYSYRTAYYFDSIFTSDSDTES